jgi:hypothetical protein
MPGEHPKRLKIRARRTHPGRDAPPHTLLFPTGSVLFPHLSVYRGIRPLAGLLERGLASAFRHCAGGPPLPADLSGR